MKAQGLPMTTIVLIIMVIVVLVGVLLFFFTGFQQGGESVTGQTDFAKCQSDCVSAQAKAKDSWKDTTANGVCESVPNTIAFCANSCYDLMTCNVQIGSHKCGIESSSCV